MSNYYDQGQQPPPPPPEESNPLVGWAIFILIFGVGNYILYQLTGIFIIPLPRR